ncbi:zinc finger protein RFP isoform X2 [Zootoca vivipara]|uniref:zinc finger protein RFP isoform X2 n=1 Tax=Zootoca vivipara TaxID=8524 RepID=UPI00293BEDE2|nr:zinc finger protein RFP isoform X2 [Zootoca vivipara]
MAVEGPVQNLCEETTCPICLEYFTDPVIIECGHNFCQTCITETWGKSGGDASCPQCREPCQQRNFRPNRQLASIVEIVKKFSLQMPKGVDAVVKVCERHQEPLKLFCEDDQAPICVVCDKSKDHREHKVIPKEEAFEEYQSKILRHLEFLNKQREEILSSKLKGETESQNLLKRTDMERREIVADFKQLHQFLEEQERLLLAQLKELDNEIKSCGDQHIAKLLKEMSSIDDLIKELEEKQKQPVTEFLQNMRSILERCNENENKTIYAIAFPPGLKEQIDKFSKMHPFLEKETKKFKDVVLSGPQGKKGTFPGEEMVIPNLVLAVYGQATTQATFHSMGFSFANMQQPQYHLGLSDNISCCAYVMGVERITSGTHSWIVNVGDEKFWAVGVVMESLRGHNIVNLNDGIGIWAIARISTGAYYASTPPGISLGSSPSASTLPLMFNPRGIQPKRIRVLVVYEAGLVIFRDADSDNALFTFNALFSGEKICSFLCMGK